MQNTIKQNFTIATGQQTLRSNQVILEDRLRGTATEANMVPSLKHHSSVPAN